MPLNQYLLKASTHEQFDETVEPDAQGRRPSRVYTRGQTVYSETDLVQKFGHEKFQYVGEGGRERAMAIPAGGHEGNPTHGDPIPDVAARSPAVFPQGQVSSGIQVTRGTEDGPLAGAATPEDVENHPKLFGPAMKVQPGRAKGEAAAPPGGQGAQGGSAEKSPGGTGAATTATTPAGTTKAKTLEDQYGGDFEDMTLDELREVARDEEVNLKGATLKDDVVKALRQHDKARAAGK